MKHSHLQLNEMMVRILEYLFGPLKLTTDFLSHRKTPATAKYGVFGPGGRCCTLYRPQSRLERLVVAYAEVYQCTNLLILYL